MSAPDASWRVEEAKLLWAQGQQDTAVAVARSLLGGARSDVLWSVQGFLGSSAGQGLGCTPLTCLCVRVSPSQGAQKHALTLGVDWASEHTSVRLVTCASGALPDN